MTDLFSSCVFTIRHPEQLSAIFRKQAPPVFVEKKRWVTGWKLWKQAQAGGLPMPVVFGDATACHKLMYWGLLTDLTLDDTGTRFSVDRLRRIPAGHTAQELKRLSNRRTLAANFIRPYALCLTPDFLSAQKIAAPDVRPTRALSLNQPYAEWVLTGKKKTEYRSILTHIRERVYIYATKRINSDLYRKHNIAPNALPTGVIVGTVVISGCTGEPGDYAWKLKNPERAKRLRKPTGKPQPVWFKPFG